MLITEVVKLIDKNHDIFKEWGCKINCVKSPWYCEIYDLVTRCVCYKLFESCSRN